VSYPKEEWNKLTASEKLFMKELAVKFSPKYEGVEAPRGVVIQEVKPRTPYQTWWVKGE
jgi:hypothetical protein